MTKTTAAPQQDPLSLAQRRLSALFEDTLRAAETWSPEDDGQKERRRAEAINALARTAYNIARLSSAPLPKDFHKAPIDDTPSEPQSPPPSGDAPDPETSPRPPPVLALPARTRATKAKAPQPETEIPMNDQRPLDPAELEALRDQAFARLDRLARRLEQKGEAPRDERGNPDTPPLELDAERPSGAASAYGR